MNELIQDYSAVASPRTAIYRGPDLLGLLRVVLRRNGYTWAKRSVDVAASGAALLILAPLFLAVALAIKASSSGPVFFGQIRVGKRGRRFRMWKFRSMFLDAEARKAQLLASNESPDGVLFKMRNDPRITPVGRILRRLSIDELPQLWNVFRGDMALVGPRPPVPQEVAGYSSRARRRLEMTPGLTCFWQVNGRSELSFTEQLALDLRYQHERSLGTDLRLLLMTVPAVLSGRGAY